MSRSNDAGHFFQTTASIEESQRKAAKSHNKNGNPIRLPSKILDIIPDTTPGGDGLVFVAESAGTARRIDIGHVDDPTAPSNPKPSRTASRKIYRGPMAPVTSLAISPDSKTLFAGCWDKCIWSWDIETAQPKRKYAGHSDFVKSVLCVSLRCPSSSTANPAGEDNTATRESQNLDLLLSGSADKSIILWSLATGQKLHTIRGGEHTMGILDLAIDPSTAVPALSPHTSSLLAHSQKQQHQAQFTLFAGSSDPAIRRWTVYALADHTLHVAEAGPDITAHTTSVNKLFFYPSSRDDDDGDGSNNNDILTYDLLTASCDNTAKRLAPRPAAIANDAPSFVETASWPHPDYVRAVAVVAAAEGRLPALLATACRDEEVRVWDLDDGSAEEPLYVFGGHYEEVTGLAVVQVRGRRVLVSVGIDGSVRRWGVEADDLAAVERQDADGASDELQEGEVVKGLMTAEEEAELAELLDDDD